MAGTKATTRRKAPVKKSTTKKTAPQKDFLKEMVADAKKEGLDKGICILFEEGKEGVTKTALSANGSIEGISSALMLAAMKEPALVEAMRNAVREINVKQKIHELSLEIAKDMHKKIAEGLSTEEAAAQVKKSTDKSAKEITESVKAGEFDDQ